MLLFGVVLVFYLIVFSVFFLFVLMGSVEFSLSA